MQVRTKEKQYSNDGLIATLIEQQVSAQYTLLHYHTVHCTSVHQLLLAIVKLRSTIAMVLWHCTVVSALHTKSVCFYISTLQASSSVIVYLAACHYSYKLMIHA
jgi:hypothetical protein